MTFCSHCIYQQILHILVVRVGLFVCVHLIVVPASTGCVHILRKRQSECKPCLKSQQHNICRRIEMYGIQSYYETGILKYSSYNSEQRNGRGRRVTNKELQSRFYNLKYSHKNNLEKLCIIEYNYNYNYINYTGSIPPYSEHFPPHWILRQSRIPLRPARMMRADIVVQL